MGVFIMSHVPLPTMPMAKMELWETSGSASWENLLSVSRILRRGLDTEIRASARGTARLRVGSPYRSFKAEMEVTTSPGSLLNLWIYVERKQISHSY